MPVTRTATRALRKSKAKAVFNQPVRSRIKTAFDAAVKIKTLESISAAFSAIDTAVKRNIIHKNKAARLKSRVSRLTK